MYRTLLRFQGLLLRALFGRLLVHAAPSTSGTTVVTYVDDPTGPIRLVHASGRLGPETISMLLRTWDHLSAPHQLHVDVTDAYIADIDTMHRIESALDRLELQRIDVRIVGIDPQHPAIAR
jgi:hypothetical protein